MKELIQKAIEFAKLRHEGQYYGSVEHDYVFHLYFVMNITNEYTNNDVLLSASVLHDILEDCKDVTYEELYDGFGGEVADIVFYLTDPEGRNRKEKKQKLYERFENFKSEGSLKESIALIKCVDRYCNMMYSIISSDYGKMKMYQNEYFEFMYYFSHPLYENYFDLVKRLDKLENNIRFMLGIKKEKADA